MEVFLGHGLTTWLVGAVVAITTYWWYKTIFNHYWKSKNIPADGPVIAFKSVLLKRKPIRLDIEEQYKRHGKLFGLYSGYTPMIVVAEPELLHQILTKDFQKFPDRKGHKRDGIRGKILPFLTGDEWKRIRVIMSSIFSPGRLRKVSCLITKPTKTLTEYLLQHADRKTNVQLNKLSIGYNVNVIASTVFGTELDCIRNPGHIFLAKFRKLLTNKGYNWRKILDKLMKKTGVTIFDKTGYFSDLLLQIREQRLSTTEKVRDDFLQMLIDIESGRNDEKVEHDQSYLESEKEAKIAGNLRTLSREELIAQCMTFLLVGVHTTASTLALVTYLLALNPMCQERLHKEVDEIWEKYQGNVDSDAASSMQYLDAVLAESLRMYPPVRTIQRKCVHNCKLGNTGITIPKGMVVNIPVYSMQQDSEFFHAPETFNPDRFLPENKDSIKPYTYIPFGSGRRSCVGMRFAIMEIKLCLVNVLRHVSFHTCAETSIPVMTGIGVASPKRLILTVERRR